MRGKGGKDSTVVADMGITPAHAGKSHATIAAPISKEDHPRTCGEKTDLVDQPYNDLGSPPHMRGKVVKITVYLKNLRITPAHAGKSFQLPLPYSST